jgi:hypothetical protein
VCDALYATERTSIRWTLLDEPPLCAQSLAKSTRLFFCLPSVRVAEHDTLSWQNMDACDASIMSPKRLATLKTLLSHPDINLLTLNAPHQSMNGVIPLCMAAWLNQPQAVRALLNDSADSVSVDGMDSHGATALMCE